MQSARSRGRSRACSSLSAPSRRPRDYLDCVPEVFPPAAIPAVTSAEHGSGPSRRGTIDIPIAMWHGPDITTTFYAPDPERRGTHETPYSPGASSRRRGRNAYQRNCPPSRMSTSAGPSSVIPSPMLGGREFVSADWSRSERERLMSRWLTSWPCSARRWLFFPFPPFAPPASGRPYKGPSQDDHRR